MANQRTMAGPEVKEAFAVYNREATFQNLKVACYLGIVLMPAGVILDYFVYPHQVGQFLTLRLFCSLLIGGVLALVMTPWGRSHYRALGVVLAMFPSFFIAWMIAATQGLSSPYYAGLNLVLLVIGFVVNWDLIQSLAAVVLVLGMYLAACWFHGAQSIDGVFFNNLYFLILTGIIVVTGSHVHSQLRFREFALRHELDASRKELEESNRKLVELDQVKSRFFANISHELRTPLTLLLAPLENLMHRQIRSTPEETRSLLGTMQANGMRLLKLINDLLDLVRLESGRMELRRETLAMEAFIKGLASATRQVAHDKRIVLHTGVEADVGRVLLDRDKLEKILLNLVFNALKFTPAGGRVEVLARRQDPDLIIQVRDTGMGISDQQLPFVFDRFWQADSSSRRKYQGAGIGLSLVKELVEVQSGTVQVTSQEGEGTTFTIRLPFEPAPAEEGTAEAAEQETPVPIQGGRAAMATETGSEEWLSNLYRRAELFPAMTSLQDTLRPVELARNGGQPRLLLADDEPDMLKFLKSQLSAHYQLAEAVDGGQALEKARQFLPDVILLDMMMPEKDGLQVCRELREHPATQKIPVVLLTARADEETKLAALSAGASDFLAKPFSTTELHVRVRNLVESFQYQRKLARQNQVLESTIEQLKETETQLVHTEKMASLGRMSAGIIHEINNPLNFATTGLYTLRRKQQYLSEDQQEDYAEILKDIEEGIARVKTIVSDLRGFTHHNVGQLDSVDVAELVTGSVRFLSHDIGVDQVRVQRQFTTGQTIWGNKNKLTQVVVNLLQNSIDALRLKTFAGGERPTIWLEGRVEAGKSTLVVRDNGPGIQPEHMDKIFDPFFTTKDVGEGMGLGLSISYRIVQEYEGTINVRSEPGQGCEFALEFPKKD